MAPDSDGGSAGGDGAAAPPDGAPDRGLGTALALLPGLGGGRARRLERLGLVTVADALMHFPRDYRDFSGAHAVADLVAGEPASLAGDVADVRTRTTAAGRALLSVRLVCRDGHVRATWFNMPFLARRFAAGQRVVIAGSPRRGAHGWEFAHPEVRWLAAGEADPTGDWLPVYPLAAGVQQHHVRTAVAAALEHGADAAVEALPEGMRAAKRLLPIAAALRAIHHPGDEAQLAAARRRFVYQELFMLQLALRMHRGRQQVRRAAPVIAVDTRLDHRIRARFPYEFTPGQRRVAAEIVADMARGEPMNRLLQGDVGSGKTALAVYAMLATVATRVPAAEPVQRYQAVLMAPTELLARQHAATLGRLLDSSGVGVCLLSGSQKARARREAVAQIGAGDVPIVVGTQALLADGVRFARLGLVVIDEQHRFGVLQRALLQRGDGDPHTLVMTATPIPRTIAHALYGDLDVSVLDEAPPGRQPVATYKVEPPQADDWWDFFARKLRDGRQGYVIVPTVDDSARGLASVAGAYEQLANGPLEAFRLGLVHGRLDPAARDAVMERFRDGEIVVLVATSLVEVGIDVPRATAMTILDAESFGLAQLHQLRGRVARGGVQGICGALVADAARPQPRIDAFVATTDGFRLAEQDLLLRGAGDLVGTRQSGSPPLYLADLIRDTDLVAEARADAKALFERDPLLSDPALARLRALVETRWGATLGLGQVG
ncbi:MAG: ATP-dependent DNA helicase RecG [Planctomycetota bacterium]